jgi:hypothetical protein
MKQRATLLGFFGLAVLLVLSLISYGLQRTLIYSPKRYSEEEEKAVLRKYGVPETAGIDLVSEDKVKIRAYWIPAKEPEQVPTILYLHVTLHLPITHRAGKHG